MSCNSVGATAITASAIAMMAWGPASLAQDVALEEITVTAQRREQSIQDVPIAITAFDEETANDLNLNKPQDLADHIPGLDVTGRFEGGIPTFRIRGLGFGGVIGAQAVAVNVDEVAFSNGIMSTGQLYDIERIEVLKGPQGDLYGRNTTGGAINFISKKPHAEREVMLQAGVGSFETFETEGVLNGALSDTVNARFSWQTMDRGEGWQTNWHTGEKLGEVSRQAARLQLSFEPSDNVSWLFNVHGYFDDSDVGGSLATGVREEDRYVDNTPPETFSSDLSDPLLVSWDENPQDNCNSTGTFCRWWPGKPFQKHDAIGGSLRLDWDFGDHYTFTSLTAYETLDRERNRDDDGAWNLADGSEYAVYDMDMFTQEFRLSAAPTDRFSWLVGLYYADDEIREVQYSDYIHLFEFDGFPPPFLFTANVRQMTESFGAFAHAEYQINDQWAIIAGFRHTSEDKKMREAGAYNLGDMTGDPLVQAVYSFDPVVLAGWEDGGFLSGNILGEASVPSDVDRDYGDSDPSGKLVLMYQPNELHTMYLSYSKGTKSGGYNGQNITNPRAMDPYDKETVHAYEFGWKGDLADGLISPNLAVYYYDYRDRQIGYGLWDPVWSSVGGIENVDETDTKGAELEVTIRPTENFEWHLGAAYVRAETAKFVAFDRVASIEVGQICDENGQNPGSGGFWCNVQSDFAGERLGWRPWQFSSRWSYLWNLSGMDLRAALNYSYRDDEPDTDGDGDYSPGWDQWGANFSLADVDGRWRAELWGVNITDKLLANPGGTANFLISRTPQLMTRTWGLRYTHYWQ